VAATLTLSSGLQSKSYPRVHPAQRKTPSSPERASTGSEVEWRLAAPAMIDERAMQLGVRPFSVAQRGTQVESLGRIASEDRGTARAGTAAARWATVSEGAGGKGRLAHHRQTNSAV
jgi:hypothetical protein